MKKDTFIFLTTLKNAILGRKKAFSIKYSQNYIKLLTFLRDNGLIRGFEISHSLKKKGRALIVFVKYDNNVNSAIAEMRFLSKIQKSIILSKKSSTKQSKNFSLLYFLNAGTNVETNGQSGDCLFSLR